MSDAKRPAGLAVTKPCANCPFLRKGAIELAPGRLENIIADLTRDDKINFRCHKTVHTKKPMAEANCVGSIVYMMKAGRPSLSMRFAMAMKLVAQEDYTRFNDVIIDPPAHADTQPIPVRQSK